MEFLKDMSSAVVCSRKMIWIRNSPFSIFFRTKQEDGFLSAVNDVVKSTVSACGGLKSFYVGVPGEFIKIVNVDKVVSFQKEKKWYFNL